MNTQDTPAAKIAAEYIKSQIESNLPGVTLKIKQMPFKQKTTLELANNYEATYSKLESRLSLIQQHFQKQ